MGAPAVTSLANEVKSKRGWVKGCQSLWAAAGGSRCSWATPCISEERYQWLWWGKGNWRNISPAICPEMPARGLPMDLWDPPPPPRRTPYQAMGTPKAPNFKHTSPHTLLPPFKKNPPPPFFSPILYTFPTLVGSQRPLRETKTFAIVPPSGKQKEGS